MQRLTLAAAAATLLFGCQAKEQEYSDAMVLNQEVASPAVTVTETSPARARLAPPAALESQMDSAAAADSIRKPLPPSVPMLALAHRYTLQAPSDRLQGLVRSHEKACIEAGPLICQVTGQDFRSVGRDSFAGELSLRATPDWMNRFRERLAGDAKAAGGKVLSSATDSDDLTRAIIDTEAAIRAKTIMRGRLEDLLADRPGKLADLLEVEQQLARVQEEINSMQSQVAVMRTRVASQSLTLSYQTGVGVAPDGVFQPLVSAVKDILATLVMAFAVLIRVFAALAPVAVVGWLIFLAIRRFVRSRPRREPAPVATPANF